mgnify:CR=1 FL=1
MSTPHRLIVNVCGEGMHLKSFLQPLCVQDESEMINLCRAGDECARNILIERNLRLVAHIVKKYTTGEKENEDLISIGTIGLIKAIDTFDPAKGIKLATYAARCIENELLMWYRSQRKQSKEIYLNDSIGADREGNEISLNDILGTEPDAIIDDLDTKIKIGVMLESIGKVLTEREKYVLIYRYGLFGVLPHTQREVAAMLGISRSYVSRIEKKALACLKGALNA